MYAHLCYDTFLYFQIKELQSESDHFKSDLAEARAQYKDCAQEVNINLANFVG